jgi:hypothetical protein
MHYCSRCRKRFSVGRSVDPDCAFWIEGERTALELESAVRGDRMKWVDAVTRLLTVVKTSPQLL